MTTVTQAVNIINANKRDFRKDFAEWMESNFAIYKEFERQSLQIAMRRSHYSARTIAEVIRHNSVIAEVNGCWKINNNRIPDMARLFSLQHPEFEGFFQLRDSDMRIGLEAA